MGSGCSKKTITGLKLSDRSIMSLNIENSDDDILWNKVYVESGLKKYMAIKPSCFFLRPSEKQCIQIVIPNQSRIFGTFKLKVEQYSMGHSLKHVLKFIVDNTA